VSVTLKKASGDLFIDVAGRSVEITGPAKTDQELASLYLTNYDAEREWGSEAKIDLIGTYSSIGQFRTLLRLKVQQANDRILTKQANDTTLTEEERINRFSRVDISYDLPTQSGIFIVVADVGENSQLTKYIGLTFQPIELNHVVAPPLFITKPFAG